MIVIFTRVRFLKSVVTETCFELPSFTCELLMKTHVHQIDKQQETTTEIIIYQTMF